MILGLSIGTFTIVHTLISLIAIVTGLIVAFGMLNSRPPGSLTGIFLIATILTSLTGFLFPSSGFTPAQGVGYISLAVLAVALAAVYAGHLAGPWRWIYVTTALIALYLNCFVLVVQAFQKASFLQPLAPTQSESPFQVAQGALLVAFVVLGYLAVTRFHPDEGVSRAV